MLTPEDELRTYAWEFGQANWVPEGFTDRMEAAGLMFVRAVTDADLETSFADERGIERGGVIWDYTDAGRKVLAKGSLPPPPTQEKRT